MRRNGFLLVTGLAILFIVVFNLPFSAAERVRAVVRECVAPYEDMVSNWLRSGGGAVASVSGIWGWHREKAELEREIARLRYGQREAETLARENAQLRALLLFQEQTESRLIPCEAIARGETTGWWQTVELNKGRVDGVAANMAVIAAEGLIGRVTDVSRQTCTVLLISDLDSKISCQLVRSSVFGIVRGGGVSLKGKPLLEILAAPDPMRMDYISKDAGLLNGDEVVTSGLGGVFPKGLLVGYVAKAYMDESGLYQHADLVPAADLRTLRYVFVVRE